MIQRMTGDPFIDAGALAAEEIFRHLGVEEINEENWLKATEWAATVYQTKWHTKVDAVWLNSVINQPLKRKRAKEEAVQFYTKVFSDENPYKGKTEDGWCRGCGQQQRLFSGGRDIFPLSGSGAFLNFHHAHETGLYLCAECLVSLFFVPFSVMQCGKNLALLQTQTPQLREFWLKKTVSQNISNLAVGKSESILKSTYKNAQNAFFAIVNELITEWYDANENFTPQDLRLFYFTNFGADPGCDIFDLPSSAFTFLWIVNNPNQSHVCTAWHAFIRRNYRIRDAKFVEETHIWRKTKGKNKDELNDEDYRNNPNNVYQMLLNGRNLLPRMYRGNQRITLVPIEIPIAYCLEVRRMKKERIDAVLALADRICDMVKKANAPKLLYPIESARYIYQFRAALLKLLKKNISMGVAQPLFTTDDFIHKLLPDGEPWTDVRDLMLIRIYEKLHEFLQGHGEEVSDETIEIPVEESQAF